MKSLYRRYRPVKLSDVVGQEQVTNPLLKALEQGKIGHAYLFVGPRGCGKTSVARILAHEINGFKYEIEDDYIDIIEIDGASNRGIDNIRELREKAAIAPTSGKYKVYIIDEVHMLTKEAFNALLKTLEEPPAHVVFIMATTDVYKVPITITSRAQCFTFKLADDETMFNHLKQIVEKEKIPIDDDAIKIIVRRGGGSFRDSLSLLDQISTLSDKQITAELVLSALGLPQDEIIADLLNAFKVQDVTSITKRLKDLLNSGIKAETIAEEMLRTIVADPSPELIQLLSRLPEVKSPYAEAKLLVALINPVQPSINNDAAQVRPVASQVQHTQQARSAQQAQPKPQPQPEQHAQIEPYTQPKQQTQSNSATEDKSITPPPSHDFDWQGYLDKVQSLSDAVYSQLLKTQHDFDGVTLHIYPTKRIVRTILTRENNKKILFNAISDNVKITIHEISDLPLTEKKDETISKISDIMGGEVINDGGTSPF